MYKYFKDPKVILVIVFMVTLYALLIDLPRIPIKFNLYNYKIDTAIGGYDLSILDGKFYRDLQIKKGLDIEGGASILLEADMTNIIESDQSDAIKSLVEVIEKRVNLLGLSESVVQYSKSGDKYRVIVELAGAQDTSQALAVIGQTAKLDFREQVEIKLDATNADEIQIQDQMPQFVTTGLTGADLRKSSVGFDQSNTINAGQPVVELSFNAEGAKKFREITQKNINKPLAIFLDENIIAAPNVSAVISNGQAIISGGFTIEIAKALATQLNAGALPVPVKVIEQRTVGPSLGIESVQKSVFAGLVGLMAVMLFMILYYRRLGIIASVALIIYGIITLAIYKIVPIVLTLPGIAGFMLSIGMAVDANILIFERIKEELRTDKPFKLALENGFGRSWDSIRDANTATIATAFILFNPFNWSFLPASGMVRGFALTLALGIFISLFTGVFVTRNLVRVFYHSKTKK